MTRRARHAQRWWEGIFRLGRGRPQSPARPFEDAPPIAAAIRPEGGPCQLLPERARQARWRRKQAAAYREALARMRPERHPQPEPEYLFRVPPYVKW